MSAYVNIYVAIKIHFVELLKQINKDNFREIVDYLTYAFFDDNTYYSNKIVVDKLFSELRNTKVYNISNLIEDVKDKCTEEYEQKYEVYCDNYEYINGEPGKEYNENTLKNIINETLYEKVINFLNDIENKNIIVYIVPNGYGSSLLQLRVSEYSSCGESFLQNDILPKKDDAEKLQKKLNLTNCEIVIYAHAR